MKTINDLVDKLNSYGDYGEYYIRKDKAEEYLLCKRYMYGIDPILLAFAKKQPYWDIYVDFGAMDNRVQKEIMDFIYTTDSNHWFDEQEKKYNIIIGEDMSGNFKTVYYKAGNVVDVTDTAGEYELVSDQYQFTESEIEELKSKVSENSAKIIDLGKVEVNDDED